MKMEGEIGDDWTNSVRTKMFCRNSREIFAKLPFLFCSSATEITKLPFSQKSKFNERFTNILSVQLQGE